MAHFSNGTEGMSYQSRYCERCRNWRVRDDELGVGCPIWDLHLLFAYQKKYRRVLDMLIPMDKEGVYAIECSLFVCNGDVEGQLKMDLD